MLTVNPSNGRGCGSRSKGSVYLCTGQSELGKRIEEFIWDPVKPWKEDWQRGYKLLEWEGVHHVAIFVGKQHYPALWDFVEEARRFGLSRKVDQDFPFEKLTQGESNMIYLHSRAIPLFAFFLDRKLPLRNCKQSDHDREPFYLDCTFAHQDLSWALHPDASFNGEDFKIEMPSFSYQGKIPRLSKTIGDEWGIGAFMATPITHIEFPQVENTKAKQNAEAANYQTFVCDW